MKIFEYYTSTIENYPDNGNHLQCNVSAPFCIRKGEDGYFYQTDGQKEKNYNFGNKITKLWICHLTEDASESLEKIFKIKTSLNLETILKYCTKTYVKSLKMELKRIENEIELFN